jgi:GT2 family glycosyltransferase
MELEPQRAAPAVVAVIVTSDPGSWLEHGLSSLAGQDYPNLSVLVVDAASQEDPGARVRAVLPGAYVMRLERRVGFGRAANEALKQVDGASHLLFCHDDVVLAPDAVRCLLEEAFRSNAGITTPKYVQWDDPERLLAVGATADKVGAVQDLIEPGELDQQQRDSVREVLVAPGGATLVRTDLFRAMGGFNATIDQFGEDLDLSWRARVAGARVVVVPAAKVQHLEAVRRGIRPGWESPADRQRADRLRNEHRLRTLLTCYRWFNLVWIIPLAVFYLLGEAISRILQGRPGEAAHLVGSLAMAMRHPGRLWRSRRRVQRQRQTGDRDIRRLQTRGNARLRAYLRERLDDARGGLPMAAAGVAGRNRGAGSGEGTFGGDAYSEPLTRPTNRSRWQQSALVGAVLLIVLVFGSRSLLGHPLPAVAQLPNLSAGWSALWRSWWSTWQPAGLGVTAPSSPALAVLGVLATVFFGAVGTLQHFVVLGPLVVGPLGAYRAARWWGSGRGRLAALIAYAVVPLPYNALARGHWEGLVAYAALPWVLAAIGRLSGEIPMPVTRPERIGGRVVGLGLLTAVAASVVPSLIYVLPLIGLGLLGGSALAGRVRSGVRMLVITLVAAAVAVVLLIPWSVSVLGSRVATLGVGTGAAGRLTFGQVLRFDTGPIRPGPLGWAFLVAAALPLFIGRGWRLAWATRLWVVAILFFWVTWAGARGWIPALPADVALAPAAAALAGSVALGVVAFELDLPGYQFGWRQLAATVSAAALALAAVPVVVASGQGRWHLPSADASSVLAFLPGQQSGAYRVLWVGSPDALPLAARPLDAGIGFATSDNGEPDVTDGWTTASDGSSSALATDLRLVQNGLTTRFGHLLAPMAVRYVVIPTHNGPAASGAVAVPAPGSLLAGLLLQTDLEVVNVDPNYTVYQNAAWAPLRAVQSPAIAAGAAARSGDLRALQQTDLSGSAPVLDGGRPTRSSGSVPPGATVYVAQTRQRDWRLTVAGHTIRPQPAFGWGMSFTVPLSSIPSTSGVATGPAAPATLNLPPSAGLRGTQVAAIVLWLVALALVAIDLRRRRNEHPPRETVRPEWFVPLRSAGAGPRRRRSLQGGLGAEDLEGEELWIDV